MIINHNGNEAKLPDFLIVGAAKSGTTSLHYYLKQHPQVFMPKVKELCFFAYLGDPQTAIPSWLKEEWHLSFDNIYDYARHFEGASNSQIIGEASPPYLCTYKKTILNIKKVYGEKAGEIKIIMILRNPIERAWSQFVMNKRDGSEPLNEFTETIREDVVRKRLDNNWGPSFDYVGVGMYYNQVIAYLNEFPKVKIFLYEELCKDIGRVVKEIFRFLDVDESYVPDTGKKYNVSGDADSKLLDYLLAKKNPVKSILKLFLPYHLRSKIKYQIFEMILNKRPMPDEVKKTLLNIYEKDIVRLGGLIQKDISTWLR